jgi:N,N'-diacetyllegionaminate synthase
MKRTLIIAEIGVNHNANWELAKAMIRSAADSGADVIKFQTAIPELVQTKSAPMAEYQVANTGFQETQLEMSKKLHFAHETYPRLKDEVEKFGKVFMSSAFDLNSLNLLASMGETTYKIPSGEITNLPYLRRIGRIAKKILLSTGMSTFSEVSDAVNVLTSSGANREDITVLQCNSEYPTPFCDVNLSAMISMGKSLELEYGYSDHTLGIEAAIAAVALGASIIEKHFTIDKKLTGPDQKVSLEPRSFKLMVNSIRNIELALGDGVKRPSSSELKNKNIVRRSIFTSRSIASGEVLKMDDLVVLRPAIGISPMFIDNIIGKISKHDLSAQYPLSVEDFE